MAQHEATPLSEPDTSVAATPGGRAGGRHPTYPWFVAGAASWAGALGLQGVLYSQILLEVLNETPTRIGLAQAANMLPPVFLLLLGGVVADRHSRRTLITVLHLGAAALAALLAAAIWAGLLTFELLLGFAITMGSLGAFVIPSRDSLLSDVAGDDMTTAVAELTIVQMGSQAVGSAASFAVRWLGFPVMLLGQGAMLLVGAAAMQRTHAAPPAPRPAAGASGSSPLAEIGAGVREVAASPALRAPWLLVLGVGILFMGPFLVAIPVMVRDFYGRPDLLGLLFMTFPLGTIAGSLAIRLRGGIRRKGRALLLSLAFGSVTLGSVGLGLPFWATLLLLSAWGVSGSIFMTASRTLFQLHAPAQQLGRVLSVYTFGLMGAAPVGATLSGLLVASVGPRATCALSGTGMLAFVTAVALLSQIRKVE